MPGSAVEQQTINRLLSIYADAEEELRGHVTRHLQQGYGYNGWYERKLLEVTELRRELQAELDGTAAKVAATAGRSLDEVYRSARLTVARQLGEGAVGPYTSSRALGALERAMVTGMQGTHFAILRQHEDLFRQIVAEQAELGTAGLATRRQMMMRSIDRFYEAGVTGFVDRRGRHWSLRSYTDMTSRTATAQAHLQGTRDRLAEAGIHYAKISDSPDECELCRPWEGRVIQIAGPRQERYPTLDDAKASGLFHPRCTHGMGAYIPGLTKAPRQVQYEESERTAQELIDKHAASEKLVTPDLIALQEGIGGELAGLEYRLKGRDSLARKLRDEVRDMPGATVAQAADNMYDVLRYTYRIPEGRYTAGFNAAQRALQQRGYQIVRIKNTWSSPGYKGINTVVRAPDGTLFELQFHTPLSLATKEPGHRLYEAWRVLDPRTARAQKLQGKMDDMWAAVRAPRGAADIGDTNIIAQVKAARSGRAALTPAQKDQLDNFLHAIRGAPEAGGTPSSIELRRGMGGYRADVEGLPGGAPIPAYEDVALIARDETGKAVSVLRIQLDSATGEARQVLNVATHPDAARQGYATALYREADRLGFNVSEVSGYVSITEQGSALKAAREAGTARARRLKYVGER